MGRRRFKCDGCTGVRAAKAVVVGVNALFIVLGIVILSVGAWGVTKSEELQDDGGAILADIPVKGALIMVTLVGCLVIVVSFIGLIGAVKRNRKMLTCYTLFLVVITMMELAIGIGLLVFSAGSQVDSFVEDEWFQEVETKTTPQDPPERVQDIMDFLDCCGYNDVSDSASNTQLQCTAPNPKPCRDAIIDYLNRFFQPIGVILIILSCVQLIAVSGSCFLLCTRKEVTDENQDGY